VSCPDSGHQFGGRPREPPADIRPPACDEPISAAGPNVERQDNDPAARDDGGATLAGTLPIGQSIHERQEEGEEGDNRDPDEASHRGGVRPVVLGQRHNDRRRHPAITAGYWPPDPAAEPASAHDGALVATVIARNSATMIEG